MIDATLVNYFSREKWPNMSAGTLLVFYFYFDLTFLCSEILFKKTEQKDLTTALSGLSQAEIAKIKSVLDRDQESWDSIFKK